MFHSLLSSQTQYRSERASLKRLNILTGLLVLAFPLVYLSVRHAVHASLFLLFGISIIYGLLACRSNSIRFNEPIPWLALLGLSSIFLATAITQFIRGEFHVQSFDGPSRIFLATAVFLYLRTRPVSYIKLLEIAIPLGLIILMIAVQDSSARSNWWGDRYSTYFVDPNTLGSQALLLGLICLFAIRLAGQNYLMTLLKMLGGGLGLYISVYAGSRGGWLSLPFLLILWVILTTQTASCDNKTTTKQLVIQLAGMLLFLGIILAITYLYVPNISIRLSEAHHDIIQWFARVDFNSSVGARLTMWEISLFQLAPIGGFSGIGDMPSIAKAVAQLQLDPVQYKEAIFNLSVNGPHSDFLAKLLGTGYIGAAFYLITIAAPWFIFWKNRLNANLDKRAAAHMGLYFMTGIFFCGLANEMISLKYSCSFYGLILACLLAEVSRPSEHSLPR